MHPLGLAVVLSLSLAQATADSTAAWKQIDADGQLIGAAIQKRDKDSLSTVLPAAKAHLIDFAAKYPKDPKAGEARLYVAQIGILERQIQSPSAPSEKDTAAEFGQIAADTTLPTKVRMVASEKQIMQDLELAYESKNPADWTAAEAQADAFQKNFGALPQGDPVPGATQTPVIVEVRQAELAAVKASGGPGALRCTAHKALQGFATRCRRAGRQGEGRAKEPGRSKVQAARPELQGRRWQHG